MASAVAQFQASEAAAIKKISAASAQRRVDVAATIRTTRATTEVSVANKAEITAALDGADLTSSILSHQVAANTVHARELAALQLKYATKSKELEEAHKTHEGLRPTEEVLKYSEVDAEDLSGLRSQNTNRYNILVQKVAASRTMHQRRVSEVLEAQEAEATGLRRETDALEKSFAEVEATYDASVRTLESQLLLLLRSKLEVRYREELEVQARRVALLREKRGDSTTALAKLQGEYEALLRKLEDQQTAHAAHVAAAAREALARQRAEMEALLKRLRDAHDLAKRQLTDELNNARLSDEAAQRAHERRLSDLRATHESDLATKRETHGHQLRMAHEKREASIKREVKELHTSCAAERERVGRALTASDEAARAAEKRRAQHELELRRLDAQAPKDRAALEAKHAEELKRLEAERRARAEADARRRKRELEEAGSRAAAEARDRGKRAIDAAMGADSELRNLDAEADAIRRRIAAAKQRKNAYGLEAKDTIRALTEAHGRAMGGIMVDQDEPELAMAGVADDYSDVRAMARARREELVRADKLAACDELKADCESYADALAALQRALTAERGAHGAEVRRQQAELDAKESELALLRAEQASYVLVEAKTADVSTKTVEPSPEARRLADEGSMLLDMGAQAGDDPVMAEWRTLVQSEKASSGAVVAQAAPTVVDLDATNARAAQLADDLKAVLAGLKTTADPAQKAQLSSKKFILESQLKMVARLQAAAAK